jgi:hypothetical protein
MRIPAESDQRFAVNPITIPGRFRLAFLRESDHHFSWIKEITDS